MARADVFARSLKVFADRTLSPQAQSAHLARVAKEEVTSLISSGRASPNYRRWVDGVEGAAEETVKPADGGNIFYRFNVLGSVCTFALSFLVNRAPIRSGKYRKSFYLGLNGKFVLMEQFNPNSVSADVNEIVIGNTQPYSRKIDVQLIGTSPLRFNVPPGLFDDAAKEINARFGTIVKAKRVYTMKFPGQYTLKNEQFHKSGRYAGRARKRAGKLVESPAIIITPLR